MDLKRIRRDGGDLIVDIERVCTAISDGMGAYELRTESGQVMATVTEGELKELTAGKGSLHGEVSELARAVSRLTQAVERLSVHIPTSIRLHL